jgi:hypothetical protein
MNKDYLKPKAYKNINQSQMKLLENTEKPPGYYQSLKIYLMSFYQHINNCF